MNTPAPLLAAPAIPALTRRVVLAGLAATCASTLPLAVQAAGDDSNTFDEDSVLKAAADFFGSSTEGLAKVIEKVFKEEGRPNGYIRGEEASAALTVGLRYGEGELSLKSGDGGKVYWSGPSIGFDAGANASKVFTLVYNLKSADGIYQRYPGVDGSFYWIGGVGVNYQRQGGVTLAPIRLGVGLRAGASLGYLRYRREKTFNPL